MAIARLAAPADEADPPTAADDISACQMLAGIRQRFARCASAQIVGSIDLPAAPLQRDSAKMCEGELAASSSEGVATLDVRTWIQVAGGMAEEPPFTFGAGPISSPLLYDEGDRDGIAQVSGHWCGAPAGGDDDAGCEGALAPPRALSVRTGGPRGGAAVGIRASLKAKLAPRLRSGHRPSAPRAGPVPARAPAAPFFMTAEMAFAKDAALSRPAENPSGGAPSAGRSQSVGAASERLPLREMSKLRCTTPDLQHTHWPGVEPNWRAALCKEKKTEDVWQRHVSPHAQKSDEPLMFLSRPRLA